jgi:hypothetical protein
MSGRLTSGEKKAPFVPDYPSIALRDSRPLVTLLRSLQKLAINPQSTGSIRLVRSVSAVGARLDG